MKRVYAIDANRVFLLCTVLPQGLLFVVAVAGLRDRMVLQVLAQLFLVFPAAVYLFGQGKAAVKRLGLRIPGWKEWILIVPLAVCTERIAAFINIGSQVFVENTISESMAELVVTYPFPVSFFVIAVMPAVCEETVYRGVLYRGYRDYGAGTAVLLTAVLFGLMHMDPNQFFYAVVTGLLFAVVNEITGSILPSVFLHLYINGRSVVLLYEAVKQSKDVGSLLHPEGQVIREQIGRLFPVFLIAVTGVVLCLYLLLRCREEKRAIKDVFRETDTTGEKGRFGAVISPALVIGVLYCILSMVWK